MKLTIPLGGARRFIQLILWTWEDRDHWGFGYGRWPTERTRASVMRSGWTDFGFHGIIFGIFEIRFWPDQKLKR